MCGVCVCVCVVVGGGGGREAHQVRISIFTISFFWLGGLQMAKSYKTEDYEFLMDKFDFDEELEYLPYSFRTEAQYVCDTHALPLTIECAKDTFNSLVEYFLSHV